MVSARATETLEWSEKALALAEELGLGVETVRARQFRGMARSYLGDLGGVHDVRDALQMSFGLGLGLETVRSHVNLGELVWTTEGPLQALEIQLAGIDFGERRGMIGPVMWLKGQALWSLFDLGRWDELLRIADELLAWERLHGRSYSGVMGLSHKALVLIRRGAVDEARSLSDELLPRARRIEDPQILAPALITAALIEHACGRLSAAVALVEELSSTTRDPFRANQVTDAVGVCLAAGKVALARKLLDQLPVAMARHRHALLTGEAAMLEAEGELEQAAGRYAQAADCWTTYGFALERALALLALGRCQLALGHTQVNDALITARDIFTRLRARPLVAETDSLLTGIVSARSRP
jgi:tetratricopeptide (TPR) repeat protein